MTEQDRIAEVRRRAALGQSPQVIALALGVPRLQVYLDLAAEDPPLPRPPERSEPAPVPVPRATPHDRRPSCPRCGGRLVRQWDLDGVTLGCLCCGFDARAAGERTEGAEWRLVEGRRRRTPTVDR